MLEPFKLWASDKPEDANLSKPEEAPPKSLGIALGGGAARGWAHIGVLRALTNAGIHADYIGGTSIGAIVGGCYLAGQLDALEEFATSLSRRKMFSLMDLSIGGSGLISGNKLLELLEDHLGTINIEDLPKPFAAVCTELGTGHEIWLRKGSLIHALRCSSSLPGVFEPVAYGGRWLVDGALVNPIPVSVCRAFGARQVIAVNLSSDSFGRGSIVLHDLPPVPSDEEDADSVHENGNHLQIAKRLVRRKLFGKPKGLPGISGVMMDSYNIIQDRIARSRLAGDPPDTTIQLRLGHIGLFDFHRAKETIELGYEATQRTLPEIREMIASKATHPFY
nr:patatin-like phospholipase family protein [Pseudovibrio stylochi]